MARFLPDSGERREVGVTCWRASVALAGSEIRENDFGIRRAIDRHTGRIFTAACHEKAAIRDGCAIRSGGACLLGTHPILQNGVLRLRGGTHTPTGIGDRSGGKEIAEKPTFENREGL